MKVNQLKELAFDLRLDVLEMVYKAKTGHIGGDFSVMEILVTLYFDQMTITPENQEDPDRDLFVLSKGHSVEAYYAVLAAKGFFPKDELLEKFSAFGSPYIGHPNNKLPGIEMNSGSLGHGLPVCVGMALASRRDNRTRRVYTVIGDGELAEGSVWEGFMAGGHYRLDNLCAVIDRNRLQISGDTKEVMAHENLAGRIAGFGWNVIEVPGHDIRQLKWAFEEAARTKEKPTAIIADTVKGFGGGCLMENQVGWHHKVPDQKEYEQIKAELHKRRKEAQYEQNS